MRTGLPFNLPYLYKFDFYALNLLTLLYFMMAIPPPLPPSKSERYRQCYLGA